MTPRSFIIGFALLAAGCGSAIDTTALCEVTTKRATCDHQTITVADRTVHWATPTTYPPDDGYPVVLLFQGTVTHDVYVQPRGAHAWFDGSGPRIVTFFMDDD